MSEKLLSGWITRMQSGFITVLTESDGAVVCHLRGKLKRGRFAGDIIAIGDKVKISLQQNSAGSIESIEPRHCKRTTHAGRRAPSRRTSLCANRSPSLPSCWPRWRRW